MRLPLRPAHSETRGFARAPDVQQTAAGDSRAFARGPKTVEAMATLAVFGERRWRTESSVEPHSQADAPPSPGEMEALASLVLLGRAATLRYDSGTIRKSREPRLHQFGDVDREMGTGGLRMWFFFLPFVGFVERERSACGHTSIGNTDSQPCCMGLVQYMCRMAQPQRSRRLTE